MKKDISQEGLKLIACVSMLLDHIGATVFPSAFLRVVGRLAFPIYCFLLTEGACRTKNPRNYALRLLIGALLSELPFDLLFFGEFTWQHQSVMVTLLVSFLMMRSMLRCSSAWQSMIVMAAFALPAQLLCADYGSLGVMLPGIFLLCRQLPQGLTLSSLGCGLICVLMPSETVLGIPLQLFAVGAMIPIALYSGHKRCSSRVLQWSFYLFYPAHLLALAVIFQKIST